MGVPPARTIAARIGVDARTDALRGYGLRGIGPYDVFQLPSGCRHAVPWTTSSRPSNSVAVVKSRQGLDAMP
jgi:hypothetical protein